MLKSSARSVIRLRGVRHNNLKNFDLDLPLNRFVVITGLSGSGKSSLAFDTLFAEGQRRYIETFSPYARQFFDRMDKPQVDSIEGIPPAIAIEQRNAVRTTRSTVGTMTEICDYMKMLWPHVAQLHCRQCGRPVRKDSPQQIWQTVREAHEERGEESQVGTVRSTAAFPLTPALSLGEREDKGSAGTCLPANERSEAAKTCSLSPRERGRVRGKSGSEYINTAQGRSAKSEVLITFDLPLSEKLSLEESLALVAKQGYQRLLFDGEIVRVEEAPSRITHHASPPTSLTVIQDRLALGDANRARFIEACEQAYHFGKGKLCIRKVFAENGGAKVELGQPQRFSNRRHCAECDIEYREPTPALFSFNHPVGACPTCRGFGRNISIDYDLVLPDRSRTLAQGVVKPWLTGQGAECQEDLLRTCRQFGVPTDVPFNRLPKKWQALVIEGEPGYGKDEAHEWPRAWYGVKGYFRWLESKAYKMHVRVLLSRYRAYTPCPDCHGKRFQPEPLLYRCEAQSPKAEVRRPKEGRSPKAELNGALTLADFYQLPIRDALPFIEALGQRHRLRPNDPIGLVLHEVRSRLGYLNDVGLGYVSLDRPTRTLSGGETERVNLTTCLGTRLVNTLFVLDEPSVGLHPRDTERLVRLLQHLRKAGNTVVVVEHEASVIRAAEQIVDLGPGHGATGGEIVFQGTYPQLLKSKQSLTGQYLSGRRRIELPQRRPVKLGPVSCLSLAHATRNNLKDLSVEIPLGRLVCVTGVSGSGKTTLVREVLLPALTTSLQSEARQTKASDRLSPEANGDAEGDDSALRTPHPALVLGSEHLGRVVLVDQSILGKTPRSNPAVYIGAFDEIRALFAQSEQAKQRGLNASAFSFNSAQGQCERCRGAGFEKIEMQFLSDVFIRCPECNGRRYRTHILEVKLAHASRITHHVSHPLSIADVLDSTVEEVIAFLAGFPESRPAQRAIEGLKLLEEVGLGYLKLGQPINTLSGGESQRLKLVRHLAEAIVAADVRRLTSKPDTQIPNPNLNQSLLTSAATLFLFDEPTTGLHFDDVRVLLKVFQRLVDAGHTVLVIEHNLDVMKSADWIIDLGPDAGDQGGQIVAAGTPEQVAACPESHTGQALRTVLPLPAVSARPHRRPSK